MKNLGRAVCLSMAIGMMLIAPESYAVRTKGNFEPQSGDMYFKFSVSAAITVADEVTTQNGLPSNLIGDSVNDDNLYGVQGLLNYRINENFSVEGGLGIFRSQGSALTFTRSDNQVFTDAGNILMFPISANINYHFGQFGRVDPYIGAGVQYTFMTNNYSDISHGDGGGGPLVKAGVAYNVDKLYTFFLEIEQRFLSSETDFFDLTGLDLVQQVDYDPTIVSLGVGLKF